MSTLTKIALSWIGHQKPDRIKERAADTLELPAPERHGGMPLMEALAARQSGREFASKPLPLQVLSNLLWAAFGINRPDAAVALPSAMNAQEIDIYAALAGGSISTIPSVMC
jgi:hypothetical protein